MTSADDNAVYGFLGYRLDPGRRQLTAPGGKPVTLRAKVFDTLLELVANAGRPIGKAELMQAVWPDAIVEENNLNQAISALRQALGDDRNDPRFIATITGRGYQFVAPVERETPAASAPTTRPLDIEDPVVDASRTRIRLLYAAGFVAALAVAVAIWPVPLQEAPSRALDNAVLVTQTPGTHGSPTLSPDGTLMAFVSDRSGTPQIWVMGLPNGQPRQLTFGDDHATSPSWSPIDDVILFQRATPDGFQSIWRVDALGAESPRVVITDARSPSFAADGRRFVFVRGLNGVFVSDLDSGAISKLEDMPGGGFAAPMPAMNARGDIALAIADEGPSGNLWLYEAASGEFRQLTQSTSEFAGEWVRAPAWMPDGERIVFAAAPSEPANSHLWQIDTRTGERTQLSSGGGGYESPVVSRDGTRLVYAHARAVFGIVSTDPETGAETPLYETRTSIALPAVSPDGQRIVYFGEHVFTLGLEDDAPRQLTSGPAGLATLPGWSRTGDAIYYYLGRTLHRLDPETGQSTLVLEDFHWSKQNWLAAHGNLIAHRVNNLVPALRKSVVHDLDTGEITKLEGAVLPTDFTRDGKTLLARMGRTFEIVTCVAPDWACTPVLDGDEVIDGAIPRWSHDEQRIYFRRARWDKPGYAAIWVVDRAGGPPEEVAEIGPYESRSVFFGITSDDQIVWNRYDQAGASELWMVNLAP